MVSRRRSDRHGGRGRWGRRGCRSAGQSEPGRRGGRGRGAVPARARVRVRVRVRGGGRKCGARLGRVAREKRDEDQAQRGKSSLRGDHGSLRRDVMSATEVYRKTRKVPDLFWNAYVCRPIAALLVSAVESTRITPNQITLSAVFVALASVVLLLVWPGHLGLIAAV